MLLVVLGWTCVPSPWQLCPCVTKTWLRAEPPGDFPVAAQPVLAFQGLLCACVWWRWAGLPGSSLCRQIPEN